VSWLPAATWFPVLPVTVTNIYTFYKRECQFRQLMSSTIGLSHGRYIRLMAISAVEILGTIPLGTFYIVHSSKLGVTPWRGWAYTHKHYSEVIQVPAIVWKNNHNSVLALEMYRWSLVLCAFLFFALFGFANEARQNYRRLYTSIASCIGCSTSTLLGSSNAYVFYSQCVFGLESRIIGAQIFCFSFFSFSTLSVPYVKSNSGVTVSVVATCDQSRQSISASDDPEPGFKDRYSPSNTVISSSAESFREPMSVVKQDQAALPAGTMPEVPSATVPPHLPCTTKSTFRAYSDFDAI
jgi:hypothetical protein